MKSVTLSAAALNSMVTANSIFECLCAQQGRIMRETNVKKPIVDPALLKNYATKCFKSFRAQMQRCTTAKQHAALREAYAQRVGYRRREFKRAAV